MLRYKTETRPGLVTLYDIRPGNGAGQFLQPRSPHGAVPLMALIYFISNEYSIPINNYNDQVKMILRSRL